MSVFLTDGQAKFLTATLLVGAVSTVIVLGGSCVAAVRWFTSHDITLEKKQDAP